MGLFKILYTANHLKNIYFEKIFKKKENPDIKRLSEVLNELKNMDKMERITALGFVTEGNHLCDKMFKKGQIYYKENVKALSDKLEEYQDKLINYNS